MLKWCMYILAFTDTFFFGLPYKAKTHFTPLYFLYTFHLVSLPTSEK